MLGLLYRCIGCNGSLSLETDLPHFPLCSFCMGSLVHCPELCPQCGSPQCLDSENSKENRKTCLRPWVKNELIQSFTASYLLTNNGLSVLRRWKKKRGYFFDRKILTHTPRLQSLLQSLQADAIVPIPQSFSRAWTLGGSPSERICDWIRTLTGLPVIKLLELPSLREKLHPIQKRQAERTFQERLENPIKFRAIEDPIFAEMKTLILVDDIMTSGRTLFQAATALRSLKRLEVQTIHAFCLGVRPKRGLGIDLTN